MASRLRANSDMGCLALLGSSYPNSLAAPPLTESPTGAYYPLQQGVPHGPSHPGGLQGIHELTAVVRASRRESRGLRRVIQYRTVKVAWMYRGRFIQIKGQLSPRMVKPIEQARLKVLGDLKLAGARALLTGWKISCDEASKSGAGGMGYGLTFYVSPVARPETAKLDHAVALGDAEFVVLTHRVQTTMRTLTQHLRNELDPEITGRPMKIKAYD